MSSPPVPAGRSASTGAAEAGCTIDRLLARRGTRHNTFGPTGARLFCTSLDNALGLRGRFCYLHDGGEENALLDPVQLTVAVDGQPLEGSRAACMWYPSHSRRQIREQSLGLIEEKFIAWDDVLCDVVSLSNHGEQPLKVRLQVRTLASDTLARTGKDTLALHRTLYGQRVSMLLGMRATRSAPPEALTCDLRLDPGETTGLLIAFSVALRQSAAQRALGRWAGCDDPLAEHRRQYQRWFDVNCPGFDCPDETLSRLWWYRWYTIRRNLCHPGVGRLPGPICYPGKSGDLARLSAAAAPLQLAELRWLRDPALLHSQIAALLEGQTEEGLYADLRIDSRAPADAPGEAAGAADLSAGLPQAMAAALQVQPQPQLQAAYADSAVHNLAALRKLRDPDNNLLLQDRHEAVERVDATALFAGSLEALGEVLARQGRKVDAQWHAGLAARCRQALRELLWDDWDRCFCDRLLPSGELQRRRLARNLLPLLAAAEDDERYREALAALADEEQLWTAHGPAAAAAEGEQPRLILPAPAALAIEAAAAHATVAPGRGTFADLLSRYAQVMCEEGDTYRPQTREGYRADDGLGLGAFDVFLDNYNDLIIRYVGGLRPRGDDTLQVAPLALGWPYFRLENLPYRGRAVTIVWDARAEGARYPGAAAGLTVLVDGAVVLQTPQLETLLTPLPESPA